MAIWCQVALTLLCAITTTSDALCAGSTTPRSTEWTVYGDHDLALDVETSVCCFHEAPVYVTSLAGSFAQWRSLGSGEVHNSRAAEFRIYVKAPDSYPATPATANARSWHAHWLAHSPQIPRQQGDVCSGRSLPGSTGWVQRADGTIYMDVDTSACGFESTPVYVSSLAGDVDQWLTGSSEVYQPTATGFRIHLTQPGGSITSAHANDRGWHVNWLADDLGSTRPAGDICSGRTEPGGTGWQPYSVSTIGNGIFVQVDTSACGFQATPVVVTSLVGQNMHRSTTGGSEIYHVSANGFTIWVHDPDELVTAGNANNDERQWHINWVASAATTGPTCTTTATTTSSVTSSTTSTTTATTTTLTATSITLTATSTTTATITTTTATTTTSSSSSSSSTSTTTTTPTTTTSSSTSTDTSTTSSTTTATSTTTPTTTTSSSTSTDTSTTSPTTTATSTATLTTATSSSTSTDTSTTSSATTVTTTSTTSTITPTSITTTDTATTTITTATTTTTPTTTTSSGTSTDTSTTSSATTVTATPTTSTTTASITSTPTTTTSSNTSTVTSTTLSATNTTSTQSTTTDEFGWYGTLDHGVAALEAPLLTALIEGNLTRVKRHVDGITVVAVRLDAAVVGASGGNLTVEVEDSEVEVTVPATLFASLGLGAEGVVLTVAHVDVAAGGVNDSGVELMAVVNVNLLSLAGRRLNVAGLLDPITIIMPANHADGLQCVYWDEDMSDWATEGVELGSQDEGIVECKATHLTLFAVVLRSFVNAFECSQVTLLTSEAIKELGNGDWHRTVGALALWCLLASFVLLLSWAAWVDWCRWRQGRRRDEHLLVPLQATRQEGRLQEGGDRGKAKGRQWQMCCAWAAGSVVGVFWLPRRGVRAFIERLEPWCSGRGVPTGGRVSSCFHHLTYTVLAITARRQVAASLGVSGGLSLLIMEDEDVFDAALAHRGRELGDLDDVNLPSGSRQSVISSTCVAREEAWGQLHQGAEAKLDAFMEAAARWSSLPCTVGLLFLHYNPISMCLVHCAFTSSKQRVLLFVVRIVGSLMLTTVFFTVSGVPKKQGRNQSCRADKPFEIVGRMLAIGTASILTAGIPALVFRSICTRGLRKCDYEGCPKWKWQLRIWRIQDWAIWILGSLYLAFCIFFVLLFLANVDQMDHGSWLLVGLLSVVQKALLIPFAVALLMPLLAITCLHFMSFSRRATKRELVSELRLQFKSRVNMNVTVGMI